MEKKIYEGFVSLSEFDININGVSKKFVKVGIKEAVSALVLNEEGKVALVKQYRPALNEETLEIPAGIIDKDKPEIQILIEELWEECGIKEENIVYLNPKPIFDYYIVSGVSDATTKIYEVVVNNIGPKQIVNDEVTSVDYYTPLEIEKMIKNKDIRDAKTLIACTYYTRNEKVKFKQSRRC